MTTFRWSFLLSRKWDTPSTSSEDCCLKIAAEGQGLWREIAARIKRLWNGHFCLDGSWWYVQNAERLHDQTQATEPCIRVELFQLKFTSHLCDQRPMFWNIPRRGSSLSQAGQANEWESTLYLHHSSSFIIILHILHPRISLEEHWKQCLKSGNIWKPLPQSLKDLRFPR